MSIDLLRKQIVIFLFMWQLGTLFCDVSASGLLCYRLFKTRKGFNTSTDSVLMSLFRISLSTASLAAIWALIDLVTYLTLAGAPPYNEVSKKDLVQVCGMLGSIAFVDVFTLTTHSTSYPCHFSPVYFTRAI